MKKILLIHGWNYLNYSSSKCVDAWANRQKFVQELQKHFAVVTFNLPGFCGSLEPQKAWMLADFVGYVDTIIKKEKPDVILGYSFGGAIALHWKYITKNTNVRALLVSPAIIRHYAIKNPQGFQKILKILLPKRLVGFLRDFYLSRVKKNPYYAKATPVMRETYRNIVTVDLRSDLANLDESVMLIYGEKDTATPPALIKEIVEKSKVRHQLEIIAGGGHDIANTHTNELVLLTLKKEV